MLVFIAKGLGLIFLVVFCIAIAAGSSAAKLSKVRCLTHEFDFMTAYISKINLHNIRNLFCRTFHGSFVSLLVSGRRF